MVKDDSIIIKKAHKKHITLAERFVPLHVQLDNRTTTTESVLCQHIKSLDIVSRGYVVIEHLPNDILQEVFDIIYGEMEILDDM